MTKPNTTYHPLGDYIRPVDVRNRDLQVTKLLGLSIEKCFIPSIANTIGTDMSTYKVVMPGQFAYGPVTSRNGDKITIALYTGDEPAIISQAYVVFEIMDAGVPVETHGRASLPDAPSQLLPEYLMMWFRRPEFDRYARYHSHGSAREIFDWAEMCATMVPVPPITEQRAVVADYEAVARRIAVAKRTIATLQTTAQTLYRKMFVDGIDKENLPEGWKWGTLGEVCEISSGKSSIDKVDERSDDYPYPVAGAAGIIGYSSQFNQNERLITTGRVGTIGKAIKYKERIWTSDNVLVLKSKYYEFCYNSLFLVDYEEIKKGGVQDLITQTDLKAVPILVPSKSSLIDFEQKASVIAQNIELHSKEIEKLTEIQTIILSGLGR